MSPNQIITGATTHSGHRCPPRMAWQQVMQRMMMVDREDTDMVMTTIMMITIMMLVMAVVKILQGLFITNVENQELVSKQKTISLM